MQRVTLNADNRTDSGKGSARSMRREGFIPAVIYKRNAETSSLKLGHKEMVKFINRSMSEQVLINLTFPDKSTRLALMKDYQVDPIKGVLLHADFIEVSLTERIKLGVKVNLVGEPIGIKRDKGILQHQQTTVEVECLPNDIPGHFDLNIEDLGAGMAKHVSDLIIPENVKVLSDPGEVLAMVTLPAVAAEGGEGEEAAEPEVAAKGKEASKED